MNALKKIGGINLLILLVYTLILGVATHESSGQYKGLGTMMALALVISIHVCVTVIMSIYYFVRSNKANGKAYLLSGLLVLVVGFSACIGAGSI